MKQIENMSHYIHKAKLLLSATGHNSLHLMKLIQKTLVITTSLCQKVF